MKIDFPSLSFREIWKYLKIYKPCYWYLLELNIRQCLVKLLQIRSLKTFLLCGFSTAQPWPVEQPRKRISNYWTNISHSNIIFLTTLSICQKLFYLPNTDRFEYGIWISFLDSFRPQQCNTMRMNWQSNIEMQSFYTITCSLHERNM